MPAAAETANLETRVMTTRTDSVRFPAFWAIAAAASIGLLAGCNTTRQIGQSLELGRLEGAGNSAYATGDFAGAQASWAEYVDLRPNSSNARFRLGRSLLALDRAREAREHFQVAHDLEPTNDIYTDALADSIARQGDRVELFAFLEQTAAEDGRAAGYIRWGRFAQAEGLADEAHRAYQTAVDLGGATSARPHRALAAFYRSLGDDDREIERWRVVLSFDGEDEQATARLRELGQVPGPSFAIAPADAG